jgi:hypothetical protein
LKYIIVLCAPRAGPAYWTGQPFENYGWRVRTLEF